MQFKKWLCLASILTILAIAAPIPLLGPVPTPTSVKEKRQTLAAVTALTYIGLAIELSVLVKLLAVKDIQRRKLFTIEFVDKLQKKLPGKNIIICNVDYSLSCTPESKQTVFYHASIGNSVSYDVLVFGKRCTFDRKGDGGYQNWAYITPTGCQTDGGHVAC